MCLKPRCKTHRMILRKWFYGAPPQSSLDALRVASPMDLRRAGVVVGVLAFALAVITGEKTDLRLCSSPLSSFPSLFRVALRSFLRTAPALSCVAVPPVFLQTWDLTPSTALPSHRRTVPFRCALHLGPPPLYLPWPWRPSTFLPYSNHTKRRWAQRVRHERVRWVLSQCAVVVAHLPSCHAQHDA